MGMQLFSVLFSTCQCHTGGEGRGELLSHKQKEHPTAGFSFTLFCFLRVCFSSPPPFCLSLDNKTAKTVVFGNFHCHSRWNSRLLHLPPKYFYCCAQSCLTAIVSINENPRRQHRCVDVKCTFSDGSCMSRLSIFMLHQIRKEQKNSVIKAIWKLKKLELNQNIREQELSITPVIDSLQILPWSTRLTLCKFNESSFVQLFLTWSTLATNNNQKS